MVQFTLYTTLVTYFIRRDVHPQDTTCASFSESLIPLLNDITVCLRQEVIEELRKGISWFKFLEDLRTHRIQYEGGKIVIRNNSKVEIDVHGAIHTLPEREVYVDTSILHKNLQRLEVPAALRAIIDNRLQTQAKLRRLHGDLACVIQSGYESTIPFLQRVWRGVIGRFKADTLKLRLIQLAMEASALTLQSWIRSFFVRSKYHNLVEDFRKELYNKRIIIVQKIVRRWTKWHLYQRIKEVKRLRLMNEAAIRFQALVRGFLGRRRQHTDARILNDARFELTKTWAAVTLQRIVRGFLSRRFLIHSFRVRRRLPPRLLYLTEKYLLNGNLWKFIEEVGDEVRVLRQQVSLVYRLCRNYGFRRLIVSSGRIKWRLPLSIRLF